MDFYSQTTYDELDRVCMKQYIVFANSLDTRRPFSYIQTI